MVRVIGELDPGAVPGASTKLKFYGGETGSTCEIKTNLLLGIVPPLSDKNNSCK